MWDQRNSIYAATAAQEEIPLTHPHLSRWNKSKSWVRQRPGTSTLIALIVVGAIVAVVVGPVISSQREHHNEDESLFDQAIDLKMTFQAQNASQLCSNFSDASFLSSYAATLQNSIALILTVQPSQIDIRSVQCGSDTLDLQSSSFGNRKLLQMPPTDSVTIVVTFRMLPLVSSSSSTSSTAGGSIGGNTDKLPEANAAASQLQSSSLILQEAVSKALGLPTGKVVLVSVITTLTGDSSPPPPPLAPTEGSALPPPPPSAPPTAPSPWVPLQGSSPQPVPGVPAIYGLPSSDDSWSPPPVYGAPPAYGL